jgi:hypothetical protein
MFIKVCQNEWIVQSHKLYCLNSVCQVSKDQLRVMVEWPVPGGILSEVDCEAIMFIMPVQIYKCLHHIFLEPPPIHFKSITWGRVTATGRAAISCVKLGDCKCQNLRNAGNVQYVVEAVLSHVINRVEPLISFASSTLSNSERNYCHLEMEGLALTFGIKNYHKFLFQHKFVLITDHWLLQHIFNPKNISQRSQPVGYRDGRCCCLHIIFEYAIKREVK